MSREAFGAALGPVLFQRGIEKRGRQRIGQSFVLPLCLTLAHQYMDQLRPEIRDAVFGNVGSIVAFRNRKR